MRKFNREALPKEARQAVNESELELALMAAIRLFAIPKKFPLPKRQVAFDTSARRLDFGFAHVKVGVEVQGGTYSKNPGKHSRGAGQSRDFKKLNDAILEGWDVLQFDSRDLEPKNLIATLETIYAAVARAEIARLSNAKS